MQKKVVADWNPSAYSQANVEFHLAVIEAAGNEFLAPLVPLLHMTSQVFAPAFALLSGRASTAVVEHGKILEAIAKRDPDEAERLARAHIAATTMKLKALLGGQRTNVGKVT